MYTVRRAHAQLATLMRHCRSWARSGRRGVGSGVPQAPTGPPWRYLLDHASVNVYTRYDHRTPFQRKHRLSALLVSFLTRAALVVIRTTFKVRVFGDFPSEGCVAVSKHDSYLDAALVVALSERVTPIASIVCAENRLNKWVLTNYGVIWANAHALVDGSNVASSGKVCWCAPKGFGASRHGTKYARARTGAVRIAKRADRAIVCLWIGGPYRSPKSLRPRIDITIGPPLVSEYGESARRFSDRIIQILEADPSQVPA